MANAYLRTCAGAINAAHTPLSILLFTRFLTSLPDLIATDRDMVDMSGQDPALDHWVTTAEAARTTTLARLQDLKTVAAGTALGDVGDLFTRVMTSDDPEDCADMRHRAAHHRQTFLIRGTDRMTAVINKMIHLALDQFEIYCALEDDFIDGDAVTLQAHLYEVALDEGVAPAA